jgi:hypothetical protein
MNVVMTCRIPQIRGMILNSCRKTAHGTHAVLITKEKTGNVEFANEFDRVSLARNHVFSVVRVVNN